MLRTSLTDTDLVRDALTRSGITSPNSAVTREELPNLVRDQLRDLVRTGLVVEGSPGRFFLNTNWNDRRRRRLLVVVAFWTIVVLLPLGLIYLLG